MPNDVKLQEGHPVDENLRPIKVGGKATALEVAQNGDGARVIGNLEVTGDITGNIKDMLLEDLTVNSLTTNFIWSVDLLVQASGDITLDAGGSDLNIAEGGTNRFKFNTNANTFEILSTANASDIFKIDVDAEGATTISTTDADTAVGHLTLDVDGDIILDAHTGKVKIYDAGDTDDYLLIQTVGGTGAAKIQTISADNDGTLTIITDGNTVFNANGHVEFDNCAVGFDKLAGAFGTSQVIEDGNDSTDIDFRLSNKYELELTDNLAGQVSTEFLNLIFPAVSGNFILVISQDGTGSRTIHSSAWTAYQSDGATKATNAAFANGTDGDLRWAGGTAPSLTATADKSDIVSIYWDADNQTAFAVISQNF